MVISRYRAIDDYEKHTAPGVRLDFVAQNNTVGFSTGVPVFIGFGGLADDVSKECNGGCARFRSWSEFESGARISHSPSYLRYAVRGFFANGGKCCVFAPLADSEHRIEIFESFFDASSNQGSNGISSVLEDIENVDLVCVPDIMLASVNASQEDLVRIQQKVLDHCNKMGDRFAILDSYPTDRWKQVSDNPIENINFFSSNQIKPRGSEGAFYFPWVQVKPIANAATNLVDNKLSLTTTKEERAMPYISIPPCGHVAGVYARTDAQVGVHKPPANAILDEVLGLECSLNNRDQAELNNSGINCLRNFARRGIRVWGARTLSGHQNYRYVHCRRIVLTLVRWAEHAFRDLIFENSDHWLWDRVKHRLEAYCFNLYQSGALKGQSPQEAYFVKCDEEFNTAEVRELGRVISEVGLAVLTPAEFIVVHVEQDSDGMIVTSPTG